MSDQCICIRDCDFSVPGAYDSRRFRGIVLMEFYPYGLKHIKEMTSVFLWFLGYGIVWPWG